MPVEEEQPEPAAAPERERGPEENAAIAAQDEGKSPEVEGEGHAFREAEAERADAVRVEDAGGRVAQGNVGRHAQAARVPRIRQSFQEACRAESVREPVHSGAAETQVGRRVDDGAGLHSAAPRRCHSASTSCIWPR